MIRTMDDYAFLNFPCWIDKLKDMSEDKEKLIEEAKHLMELHDSPFRVYIVDGRTGEVVYQDEK